MIILNKDEFKYTLPFQVELNDNIDLDTIELDIDDFAYELVENDSLKINIVYNSKRPASIAKLYQIFTNDGKNP